MDFCIKKDCRIKWFFISFFIINLFFIAFISSAFAKTATSATSAVSAEKGGSDYIIIKHRSVKDLLEDADYLYSIGKYEEALALYNYISDITKGKYLTEDFITEKKEEEKKKEKPKKLEKSEKVKKAVILPKPKVDKPKLKLGKPEFVVERFVLTEKAQKEIDVLYKKAIPYYKGSLSMFYHSQEKLDKSKEIFEQILVIDPTQKKAGLYIDKKIPARKEKIKQRIQKMERRELK